MKFSPNPEGVGGSIFSTSGNGGGVTTMTEDPEIKVGEHIDHEEPATIKRTSENFYQINTPDGSITVSDEFIADLAETAGWYILE